MSKPNFFGNTKQCPKCHCWQQDISDCPCTRPNSSDYIAPKTISDWQIESHSLAKEKGWYDIKRSTVETYTMIAGEAFEAIKDFRESKPSKYYEGEKPCGEAVEMADIVLRVMDYCEYRGWSLEELIKEKHEFNKTRTYRHNGKKV